ncbi:hypothetical protein NEUTE1DRAFT_135717 [Neurospora tetrasperma FGSC 2508]|uniref:Uncharacterized protein n=1 Tax=Neurospora tetrasperma (strain FGSC 2508 / ATCC MYA-4615 / P0657) TaxID=510951 RepID=F8MGE1_NEUT8|nr:uncharacterized protein NEUTE1DRAFT_135717 [Neurospora tetrasperma FGSC 2508]EGO58616.1 hypothetical protein NEUTE1DRAFT_135717 [Neurospora tetrasperma FGSC 2508]EGZ72692.1 hypothetical protein NEUTE2DRAFT_164905 [Neurospora tetrasperma FGSC 2509]
MPAGDYGPFETSAIDKEWNQWLGDVDQPNSDVGDVTNSAIVAGHPAGDLFADATTGTLANNMGNGGVDEGQDIGAVYGQSSGQGLQGVMRDVSDRQLELRWKNSVPDGYDLERGVASSLVDEAATNFQDLRFANDPDHELKRKIDNKDTNFNKASQLRDLKALMPDANSVANSSAVVSAAG